MFLIAIEISGLSYKPMMMVNDNSRVTDKVQTSLTDDARVVIYNCHMFIVQATGFFKLAFLAKAPKI
jgi:hypothetical protein